MDTTTQREFVIPLENRPGMLAEVASALGKANINVIGFLCESQGEFGIFRFIPSDAAKTEGWLKETRRAYRSNEVVIAPIPNSAGELGRVSTSLSKSGVNVLASYPCAVAKGYAIAFAVDSVPTAKKVLST